MTIDPPGRSSGAFSTPSARSPFGALADALLSAPGDPRQTVARWLADRLSATVVVFDRVADGMLVPRAVSAADPGRDAHLRQLAHSHLLTGQRPDVGVDGQLRVLADDQVRGSFLAAWHDGADVSGILVAADESMVVWAGRPGGFDADEQALVTDLVPWLQLLQRERRLRWAAERGAEDASSQLASQQDSLAAARQLLDRVALASGTELRDTTRRLQGWLRLATAADVTPDVQGEMVRKVAAAADQLAAQVGDLLDRLDRESARRAELELVDLNGVAAWVRRTLDDRIQDRRARVITTNLPSVHGSPSDFRRILLELVGNALEHGGRFVEVVIATRSLPDGALELTVSDSGPGVPVEQREAVFTPGFQTGGGAGFGLTRLHLLIEARDGTIAIDESDQGGCCVRVVLPRVLKGMKATPQDDELGQR